MDVEMDKSGIGRGCRRLLHHGLLGSLCLRERKPPQRPTRPAMVVPQSCGVHAERAIVARRPAFPQAAGPAPGVGPQSWGINCAQTAIIPTNSVIDASAAASST